MLKTFILSDVNYERVVHDTPPIIDPT